ncbi:MAG: alpha/beta hydrolase [Acidobacteria bacterium]|nr:alpha/beta hydrolase [Acidobacteriota bacterium]
MRRSLLFISILSSLFSAAQSGGRDVDLTAGDGAKLKATFYPAAANSKPAPAVMLLHMCNTNRKSWAPVAEQLSAAGINAFAMDNRGFGESGGPPHEAASLEEQQQTVAKWPEDFDAGFAWMLAQPGVDRNRVGAGGGSCGVINAVKLASRHHEIRSLVLLAGSSDTAGLKYLQENAWIPLFTAAAADDEYDSDAPQIMRWFAEFTGNPRNRFAGFQNGRHGTEIFGPHPELAKQIVEFYQDTLVKNPASKSSTFIPKKNDASRFWAAASEPGGAQTAVQMFHAARKRDAQAFLFPEFMLNQLAYERLQRAGINMGGEAPDSSAPVGLPPTAIAQAKAEALTLFKLIVEAYPASANAQDSLADGYLANGQTGEAIAAEQQCLELLPGDKSNEEFKKQLRQAAEEKLAKLRRSAGL